MEEIGFCLLTILRRSELVPGRVCWERPNPLEVQEAQKAVAICAWAQEVRLRNGLRAAHTRRQWGWLQQVETLGGTQD